MKDRLIDVNNELELKNSLQDLINHYKGKFYKIIICLRFVEEESLQCTGAHIRFSNYESEWTNGSDPFIFLNYFYPENEEDFGEDYIYCVDYEDNHTELCKIFKKEIKLIKSLDPEVKIICKVIDGY
jgi:hypothetical protein